jgi:hypothetical protein
VGAISVFIAHSLVRRREEQSYRAKQKHFPEQTIALLLLLQHPLFQIKRARANKAVRFLSQPHQ